MLSSCEPSPAVERLELVASAAAAAIGEPPTAPGRVEVAAIAPIERQDREHGARRAPRLLCRV